MSQSSILVIEDDARFGEQVVELFGFLGHDVTLANTGASGLQAFAEQEFALLVCDLSLPDMGGSLWCARSGLSLAARTSPF